VPASSYESSLIAPGHDRRRPPAERWPSHNLGSGTGLPARSARPRNHPQAGPEIVPHDALHNGRTEPAPVRQPPRARHPRIAFRPGEPGPDRGPPVKRPAGWSPFAGIARIRSLGSPFSLSAVPASQPSRRDSGYPAVGAVQLPRSPRRQCSSCAAPMTGARAESPGMHGLTSWFWRKLRQRGISGLLAPGVCLGRRRPCSPPGIPRQPYEAADMACVHLTPAETRHRREVSACHRLTT
jgi:hypothetical protein